FLRVLERQSGTPDLARRADAVLQRAIVAHAGVRSSLRRGDWGNALRVTVRLVQRHPGALARAALAALQRGAGVERSRRWMRHWLRLLGIRRVRYGTLRRLRPLSTEFGFDRGQPIDRYYIECFLAHYAQEIR